MDTITKIIKFCAESITTENFSFWLGDAIDLENDFDNANMTVFGLESMYAIDSVFENVGLIETYKITCYILLKSELDNVALQREDYFQKAMIAQRQFLRNLDGICYNSVTKAFHLASYGITNSIKVIQTVANPVQSTRVKNQFSANTDGLLINLSLTLTNRYNECLNKFDYE